MDFVDPSPVKVLDPVEDISSPSVYGSKNTPFVVLSPTEDQVRMKLS